MKMNWLVGMSVLLGFMIYGCEILALVHLVSPLCGLEFFSYFAIVYSLTAIGAFVIGFICYAQWARCALAFIVPPLLVRHAGFLYEVGPSNLWPPLLLADFICLLAVVFLAFVAASLRTYLLHKEMNVAMGG